jgi:hypothetical protein
MIQHSACARSVSHFGSRGIRSFCDELETTGRSAMWTLRPNGILVDDFVLVLFDPHQLEALWTATDLRSHNIPLTLPHYASSRQRETNLVQDAVSPQERKGRYYVLGPQRYRPLSAHSSLSAGSLGEGPNDRPGTGDADSYRLCHVCVGR